ncbi:TetR family transcriptional regulator [Streptomyces sp. NPDC055966]|uniref:TetR family transcriptional regulator n=1 Tax=unclassified Streptomyces TaxID=2593676 RepID=UPI0035DB0879
MNEQVTRETEPGRRDRKKAATRSTLLQTATRMFAERGYQDTTVKDIAAAAGVTERTFFRYFPSKEDLVFAEILDFVPLVQREILRRPADEPPLTAVLNSLLAAASGLDGGLAILVVGAPPRALTGRAARRTHVLTDFEDGITAALAERFAGLGPEEPPRRRALRASVLARSAVAAVRSALLIHAGGAAGTGAQDEAADGSRGAAEAGSAEVDDFGTLLQDAFAVLRSPEHSA